MSVSIALVLIPFFLIGVAFSFGIIQVSPQGGAVFVQNLENAKGEILDLAQGKTTITESFDRANTSVGKVTEEGTKKLDNVIKYAQKKVDPSSSDAEVDKPMYDAERIEYLVHEFTNQERLNHGLSQLAIDSEISQIARGHSSDMADREYFAHDSPEGLTPTDRAEQNGYSCQKIVGLLMYSGIAENIFQGHLFDSYYTINGEITSFEWNTEEEIAKTTVEGWMNSPGHRENILTDIFDKEGIGVEITEDHKVYVTQNFC